jgi:imidazolonepropionase-like amidohydrolase
MCAAFVATNAMMLAPCPARGGFEIPGADPDRPIVLTGGTVHPISGEPIDGGVLVIRDGKIEQLGTPDNVDIPPGAQTLDVQDMYVYPGLIDAHSSMGLVEIEAVRATRDMSEAGAINPNARAVVAFQPDSDLIPVARAGGVLATLSVPSGGLLAGQSALMLLDGWNANDMALIPSVGIHINWPSTRQERPWMRRQPRREQRRTEIDRKEQLNRTFDDARAYLELPDDQKDAAHDLRLAAIAECVAGRMPVLVHADDVVQIQEAVAFAKRHNLRLMIVGGYDAPRCTTLLTEHDVPVVITGTHRLPLRRDSPYDEPFTLPARLHQAGVRFCLSGSGGASAVRNLPYHAATAVAYGLDRDEALKAITLYPAQILGAADRIGSLEPGKDATLIVATGDILEIPTQVVYAYVQGRPVDLDNRHKRLWRKYKEKYERQAAAQGPRPIAEVPRTGQNP